MGGYVRMDKDLEDDPRVLELTEALLAIWIDRGVPAALQDEMRGCARDAVIGGLYRLWRHADTHLKRYDRLSIASHGVVTVTGLPASLIALFPSDWLIEHSDRMVELPGYTEKNALIHKDDRREKGRARTRRWRQRKRAKRDASQASPGDTSQGLDSVTTGTGPGTGTGTGPSQTGTGTLVTGKSRKNSPPMRAALARAQAPLARRAEANGKPGVGKSATELEQDALKLARDGLDSTDIAHMLSQYGVTPSQVSAWISGSTCNEPASREG